MRLHECFVIILCHLIYTIQSSSREEWLEWNKLIDNTIRSRPMQRVYLNEIYDVTTAAKYTLPNENVVLRIDRYQLDANSTHFFFAWHPGTCNGLKDTIWKSTNGGNLANMVSDEIKRMKTFGIMNRGGIAIDIGAHIGDSTIPIALLANHTIAFDPGMTLFPVLKTNAVINHHLNIDAYNIAIGKTNEEIDFEYSEDGFECNGGVAHIGDRKRTTHLVKRKSVILKDFLMETYSKNIISQIRYIKIDCEGYDTEILISIMNLIISIHPKPIIQIEYFFHDMDLDHQIDNKVSLKTLKLIKTILNLPGQYSIFCTKQCNDGKHCDMNINEIYIKNDKNETDSFNFIYADTNKKNRVACADFLLLPAHHMHNFFHRKIYRNQRNDNKISRENRDREP